MNSFYKKISNNRRHSVLLLSLSLTLLTLAVFWQVQNHGFINYDDDVYVTNNNHVQSGLTKENITWAFSTLYHGNWSPLTWLSHMLDCQLYRLNPKGHHFNSLLIHVANTLLLFLILQRSTGMLWRSAFVATLFALHPLHVEPVAWVSSRKDVLSTFFWMLTMFAYIHYVRRLSVSRYIMTLLFFALGLMCKPMLVTLPFVLLLLDYWPLERFRCTKYGSENSHSIRDLIRRGSKRSPVMKLLLEKMPLILVSIVASSLAFYSQRLLGALPNIDALPLKIRFANVIVSYVKYMIKTIWPHHLAVFYPYLGMPHIWRIIGAVTLLLSISIIGIRKYLHHPYLIVGWFWYILTLLPVIGLVQVGSHIMADRYTYVPLIGLFVIIAWGIPSLIGKWRYHRIGLTILAGLAISYLIVYSSIQLQYWRNSTTLFEHAIEVTTDNYVAHNNLGQVLFRKGEFEKATLHFSEALRIKPQNLESHYNMGAVLAHQGKFQEAISHLSWVLRINPNSAGANYNLGLALTQRGKFEKAISHFYSALHTDPDNAEVHFQLGVVLAQQGKLEDAIVHYTKALSIKPNYSEAHNNLGVILYQEGKLKKAIPHYRKAIRIKPSYMEAHYNLGVALARQEKFEEAIAEYYKALQFNPFYEDAHNNLAILLAKQGRVEQAIKHYTEVLRIKPDHEQAHTNLGILLASQGKFEEAIAHHREALRIKSDFLTAHINIGIALAHQGRFKEAMKHYVEALKLNPNSAEAHFYLGLTLSSMGENEPALKEYEILKSTEPNLAKRLFNKISK